MSEDRTALVNRFVGHIRPNETGCWVWNSRITQNGYAQFTDRPKHTVQGHRWSYEWLVGKIPEGMVLDHLCENRKCVNPEHLKVCTQLENWRRGNSPSAINARKTECKNGHPFDDANTYRSGGHRTCRLCNKAAAARYYTKKRNAKGGAA